MVSNGVKCPDQTCVSHLQTGSYPFADSCFVPIEFVVCIAGTYLASGSCYACMIGTYQNQKHQAGCTKCTSPKTTNGMGSTSSTDCGIGIFFSTLLEWY